MELLRAAKAELYHATGHRYAALERQLEKLDTEGLMDFTRLVRELKSQVSREKRLRRTGQWRG